MFWRRLIGINFANRLKQAGVPSAHVEADILEANLGELATKADILDGKKRIVFKYATFEWHAARSGEASTPAAG